MPQARYTIGEMARRTGVKVTTIRWYETEKLLPPPARSEGGHRLYSEDHLRRLGFLRHARELGFPMQAVRALMELANQTRVDCGEAHAIATAQIAEVDSRLRRLQMLRAELVAMTSSCTGGTAQDCRILETLADFGHRHCHYAPHDGGAETAKRTADLPAT